MNIPSKSDAPTRDTAEADRLVHWLLGSLEWDTTVFHVGQYCGRWRASTAGRSLASFHLVLQGECFLHLQGREPVRLGPRDGVFLLRDVPHFLSPRADAMAECAPASMQPLLPAQPGGTGLACGFFGFRGALSELMASSFPEHVVLRAGEEAGGPAGQLFELMLAEAQGHGEAASPLIARLADLLFFYVMRRVARSEAAAGVWALARQPAFAPLLQALLREPGRLWAVEEMAALAHMSRARFFRQFQQACGQAPAQFLLLLRMQVAAQRLERGESITRAAEHVGYQSYAAFSRAFKKVLGEQPGAWQRARRRADAGIAAGTH